MRFRMIVPVGVLLMLGATASLSQTFTDDELSALFQKQRDAYTAVHTGVGLTRGLEILPMDGAAPDAGTTEKAADGTMAATKVAPADEVGVFPDALQINVQIKFDFDSAKLNDSQKPALEQLCRVMKSSDVKKFQILGHTDASGTAEYNQQLSQLRAEEVKRFFVSDCGLEAVRLEAVGMGERVLRDNADPKSPENRRVEFQALS